MTAAAATATATSSSSLSGRAMHLEHLECSYQPHIQGQGAKKRTQRAGCTPKKLLRTDGAK